MKTRLLKVDKGAEFGHFEARVGDRDIVNNWVPARAQPDELLRAATYMREKDVPVAFPTETVYGLGADATRSAAVKGIYAAKGRPSDNPLIIHVSDLAMLRRYLEPAPPATDSQDQTGEKKSESATDDGESEKAQAGETDSTDEAASAVVSEPENIPEIYKPLIDRFWPGPLTILFPNPEDSNLAPEVTAGLKTFGARMPASALARTLISLVGAPLAAPSANASTRPSPTSAQHVLEDLDGRIELILDGGPCQVGVESTVVDGLCDPPVVLRPGGVSLEELRACPGWENVAKAYKDKGETGQDAPRAPGMKYKHYSPKARVVLYESATEATGTELFNKVFPAVGDPIKKSRRGKKVKTFAIIRTQTWSAPRKGTWVRQLHHQDKAASVDGETESQQPGEKTPLEFPMWSQTFDNGLTVMDAFIGPETFRVARHFFSALRELDARGTQIIYVEGIEDHDDIAAAVMNRLRKAASEIVRP